MSDQITIEGKDYISSKRASELSGYSQDYIGQLARGSQIDAQRIGGLWFVQMPSLEAYKAKAESFKPTPPPPQQIAEPESLLTFDGKDYVSASRAAKLTGYHQDYVGQLARSGAVLSRQIGNRWYVEREGLTTHKKAKDALLAAVQAESVGIIRTQSVRQSAAAEAPADSNSYMTYTREEGDLIPVFGPSQERGEPIEIKTTAYVPQQRSTAPIRRTAMSDIIVPRQQFPSEKKQVSTAERTISYTAIFASSLTVVIVLTVGITTLKNPSMYAAVASVPGQGWIRTATLGTEALFSRAGDMLENILVPDIRYTRP